VKSRWGERLKWAIITTLALIAIIGAVVVELTTTNKSRDIAFWIAFTPAWIIGMLIVYFAN
jgi:hypothetical protein